MSRVVGGGEGSVREYTVGSLVQTNYGHLHDLAIGGVPIDRILKKEKEAQGITASDPRVRCSCSRSGDQAHR